MIADKGTKPYSKTGVTSCADRYVSAVHEWYIKQSIVGLQDPDQAKKYRDEDGARPLQDLLVLLIHADATYVDESSHAWPYPSY